MTNYYFTHCNFLATRIRTYQKENNEIAWRGLLTDLKYYCQQKGFDFSIFDINENPISPPQLPTADLPLPAVTENQWATTANVPIAVATGNRTDITTANIPLLEIDQTPATVFKPPPIIQFSRANKCKLETCLNDADGRIYCSDKCRVKWHNTHNRKPSKKSA